jgi:hypothetical protein
MTMLLKGLWLEWTALLYLCSDAHFLFGRCDPMNSCDRYLCCDGKKKRELESANSILPLSINSGDASRASELTCTQKAQMLALANKPDYGKEKKRKKKHYLPRKPSLG